MARDVFNSIPVPSVGRNSFNLSHTKHFNCDAGQIIPILCTPFIPGDHFKIGNNIVVRPQPMVAPVMSEMNVFTYYFAVSNRILLGEMIENEEGFQQWEIADRRWEKFITGGITGNITAEQISIPRWMPNKTVYSNDNSTPGHTSDINVRMVIGNTSAYSLWDYFGFPVGLGDFVLDERVMPLIFPKRAYNMIYNWYFRDKNLEPDEVNLDSEKVLNCCWQKDYFTSALPWTQRGTSEFLALPVNITGDSTLLPLEHDVNTTDPSPYNSAGAVKIPTGWNPQGLSVVGGASFGQLNGVDVMHGSDSRYKSTVLFGYHPEDAFMPGKALNNKNLPSVFGMANIADHNLNPSTIARHLVATTFDINDLRLASRVQQWLERNAVAGSDYSEFILAHYGVAPRDDRLQKPLFLGSSKNPIWISEVLQSDRADGSSPLGSLAGHGLSAGNNYICRYSAKEFGWIIGLMIIKPKPVYSQGIPRYFQYSNRFEYPFPEFAHLGEQDIRTSEIGIYGQHYDIDQNTGEPAIFGYTGRFNELRYMHNICCGGLRPGAELGYWVWSRYFSDDPTKRPQLNNDFVKMRPDKSIFAVQDEPSFVVSVGNVVDAWRPLPKYPTPEVI